jgi:hypothetical protein
MPAEFPLQAVLARRLRETPGRYKDELVHVQILEQLQCGHEWVFETWNGPYEPRRRRRCRECVGVT